MVEKENANTALPPNPYVSPNGLSKEDLEARKSVHVKVEASATWDLMSDYFPKGGEQSH